MSPRQLSFLRFFEPAEFLSDLTRKPQASPPPAAVASGNDLDEDLLLTTWLDIRARYFPERCELDSYRVRWSYRQNSLCLASCNIKLRRVLVATAMQVAQSRPFLEPLLYHEMCHAVVGFHRGKNGRRIMHGPEFKALEQQHPRIRELDYWIKSGGWSQAVRIAHTV